MSSHLVVFAGVLVTPSALVIISKSRPPCQVLGRADFFLTSFSIAERTLPHYHNDKKAPFVTFFPKMQIRACGQVCPKPCTKGFSVKFLQGARGCICCANLHPQVCPLFRISAPLKQELNAPTRKSQARALGRLVLWAHSRIFAGASHSSD